MFSGTKLPWVFGGMRWIAEKFEKPKESISPGRDLYLAASDCAPYMATSFVDLSKTARGCPKLTTRTSQTFPPRCNMCSKYSKTG